MFFLMVICHPLKAPFIAVFTTTIKQETGNTSCCSSQQSNSGQCILDLGTQFKVRGRKRLCSLHLTSQEIEHQSTRKNLLENRPCITRLKWKSHVFIRTEKIRRFMVLFAQCANQDGVCNQFTSTLKDAKIVHRSLRVMNCIGTKHKKRAIGGGATKGEIHEMVKIFKKL